MKPQDRDFGEGICGEGLPQTMYYLSFREWTVGLVDIDGPVEQHVVAEKSHLHL